MNNYIGSIIKSVREENGFTQKYISDGICTVRQLSRIESNLCSPSVLILQELSSRMNEDLSRYFRFSGEQDGFRIKCALDNTYFFLDHHQLKEASLSIRKIDDIGTFNDVYLYQEIQWLKLLSNDSGYTSTSSNYIELLKLTKNFNSLSDVFQFNLSQIELNILFSLACQLEEEGNSESAEKLLCHLIGTIESKLDSTLISLLLRTTYFYATLLVESKHYSKAIEVAKQGIHHCLSHHSLYQLADLYKIISLAYGLNGYPSLSKKYQIKSSILA